MKKNLYVLLLMAIFILLFPVFVSASPVANDPWYEDVPIHYWAYKNIRTLWEEEVLDGYVYYDSYFPDNTTSRFVPKDECSRGQFVMMLAKMFQLQPVYPSTPTFLDVSHTYCLYHTKPAFAYIESAHSFGLIRDFSGSYLYPEKSLTREDAAVLLIRALGLTEYAENMTHNDVNSILLYFSDHSEISPQYRRYIAAAVKFQILYGYGTDVRELRPKRNLTRDEAAAILYRSCLVRAQAEPDKFNPYYDGEHAATRFQITPLKNRNMLTGDLIIASEDGLTVHRQISFTNQINQNDIEVEWDGSDSSGQILPPGTYSYRCHITDRKNQLFTSAPKPVIIDKKTIAATLNPTVLKPGQMLTLYAWTLSDALAVTAHFDSDTVHLKTNPFVESTQKQWVGKYVVPVDALEKEYTVRIEANYPHALLQTNLAYQVIDPLHLSGALFPLTLRAGEKISITAETSDNVTSVHSFFPFGTVVALDKTECGQWQGSAWIPLDTQDGLYTVHLQAKTPTKSRWLPLDYEISGNLLTNVRFILSD